MEDCANTYYTNKYLEEQETIEKIQEDFQNNVEDQLQEISDQLSLIRASAKNYEGCDLTEFAEELIGDTV